MGVYQRSVFLISHPNELELLRHDLLDEDVFDSVPGQTKHEPGLLRLIVLLSGKRHEKVIHRYGEQLLRSRLEEWR